MYVGITLESVLRIYTCRGEKKLALCRMLKDSTCNAGDLGDTVSIPGLERSREGRNGNPLQYSCWENPMDRGA